jgi:molecular chaperone DnaK (HSP70)
VQDHADGREHQDKQVSDLHGHCSEVFVGVDWPSFDEAHVIVERLVNEAADVSSQLGATLLDQDGVALSQAKQAVDSAEAAAGQGHFEGVVLESHSAACAYATFARSQRSAFILVIDMGAGTTDIAGFERESDACDSPLTEVEGTCQCCTLAGDVLDGILVNLFVRTGGKRALAAEDKLWRAVNLSAKELKHELLRTGKRSFKHAEGKLRVRRQQLDDDAAFKDYCRALTRTVEASLLPLFARAQDARADHVTVLLAGGGANMAFLADLVRAAAARCKIRLKLSIERFGSNWALPHKHHPLAGVFPQMAISMGGVLAPLAIRSEVSRESVLEAAEVL